MGVWLTADKRRQTSLASSGSVPAIIVLGSPWFLGMLHRFPELKTFFFERELAGRLAGQVDGRHGSKLYYLPVSLLGWLPWWPGGAWLLWHAPRAAVRGTFQANNGRPGDEGSVSRAGSCWSGC